MASMEEALLDCDDVAALDPLDENAVVSFIGARYRKAALSKTAWPGPPGEKRPVASTFASHAHLPVAAASPPHDSGEGAGVLCQRHSGYRAATMPPAKRARAAPSWRSGGSAQRQSTPQAAPGSGQARPVSRVGPIGRVSRSQARPATQASSDLHTLTLTLTTDPDPNPSPYPHQARRPSASRPSITLSTRGRGQ